jgi:hypothetical protein
VQNASDFPGLDRRLANGSDATETAEVAHLRGCTCVVIAPDCYDERIKLEDAPMRNIAIALTCLLALGSAHAQAPVATKPAAAGAAPVATTLSIEKFTGDLLFYSPSKNIPISREWYVVKDTRAPASLVGATGARVEFNPAQFSAAYEIAVTEPVLAVEVRYIVFDAFNEYVKTLSATQIRENSSVAQYKSFWRVWNEFEAEKTFATIAYIANIRTADGRLYSINDKELTALVKQIYPDFIERYLVPARESAPK